MRFRVEDDKGAEESRFADQRKTAEAVATMTARADDGSSEVSYGTYTIQIETAEFLIVAGAVRREKREIAVVACAKNQGVGSVAFLHNRPPEQRKYALRRRRIGDEFAELNKR